MASTFSFNLVVFDAMIAALVEEYGQIQDYDANGLLWLDRDGNVLTQAQVDLAVSSTGPARVSLRDFTPKMRDRTREEVWGEFAISTVRRLVRLTREKDEEKRRKAVAPAPDIPVTPV